MTEGPDAEIRLYVKENLDLLADVLSHSQDPYARACALVLLKRGGTKRDVEAVKEEIDRCV